MSSVRLVSPLHRKPMRFNRIALRLSQLQKTSIEYISTDAKKFKKRRSWQTRFPRWHLRVTALVAVDYSQPAIWLGLGLIGGGLGLYQLRRVRPILSRDFDVVVSSVSIFSGGILIFQLLTAGTALAWALEAINLRRIVDNDQRFDERSRAYPPLPDLRYRQGSYDNGLSLPPSPGAEYGSFSTDEEETEDIEPLPKIYDAESYLDHDQLRSYSGMSDNAHTSNGRSTSEYPAEYITSGYYEEEGEDNEKSNIRKEGAEQSWGSRVLDEVENFYNRPNSIVDDVEKFYDKQPEASSSTEEISEEELRSDYSFDNRQSSDRTNHI